MFPKRIAKVSNLSAKKVSEHRNLQRIKGEGIKEGGKKQEVAGLAFPVSSLLLFCFTPF